MLAEPPPSQGDLHFRIAGFPVRVHPFFWLMSLIMGATADSGLGEILLWVAVVFVSILVHELGHAVLQRKFGGRPRIVLHGFGGLAITDDVDRSPMSQILISLAGPAAGFLLAALTLIVVATATGHLSFLPAWATPTPEVIELYREGKLSGTGVLLGDILYGRFQSPTVNDVVRSLLYVNIFWGLVNLLPVYPLDGGQVAREVLMHSPHVQQGIMRSMQLSMVVAGAMALWGLSQQSWWMAILFGSLAYNNYQTLQAYTGRGPGAGWR